MTIRRTRQLVCLTVLAVVLGILVSPAEANPAPAPRPDRKTRQQLIRDTVYHVQLSIRDTSVNVFYGSIPLVECRWRAIDRGDAENFAGAWRRRPDHIWQQVIRRKVWAGRPAVSDTVIAVIARVSSVDPELIRRVMPSRFEVHLTGEFSLRVMTPEGAAEDRPFAEAARAWWARWRPWHRRTTLELIVTAQDAQTLYYALEPGTPVLLAEPASPR